MIKLFYYLFTNFKNIIYTANACDNPPKTATAIPTTRKRYAFLVGLIALLDEAAVAEKKRL